jgi:hypothetical protein
VVRLQNELAQARQEGAEQVVALRAQAEAAEQARLRIEVSLQSRFNETALLTRRILELQDRLDTARAELQEQADARATLERALQEAGQRERDAAADAATNALALASRLELAQARADRARASTLALRGSTSWRLTAPMRAIRGGARGEEGDVIDPLSQLRLAKLFDAEWYLATYPDVAEAGFDPAEHFLSHGAAEGRNPGPHFDSAAYLTANPDVAAAGANPLLHYIEHGQSEGRPLRVAG